MENEGKPACGRPAAEPGTCQVCGTPLTGAPVVLCRTCGTAHHRECWRYNRGCSVYGCGCRTSVAPSPVGAEGDRFEVLQPPAPAVFAVLMTAAVLSLLAGIGGSIAWAPWLAALGVPLYVLLLLASIFYQTTGAYRLTFDPATGQVQRQLLVAGREVLRPEPGWLGARDIVEVHLHRWDDGRFGPQTALFVALRDGTRRLLRKTLQAQALARTPPVDFDAVAERVAAFADTTVRLFETQAAPSADEIRQAAEEREALGAGKPQGRLAGPPDA